MEITVDASAVMAVILNEASRSTLIERTRGAELLSAPTLPWEVGNSLSALFKRDLMDLSEARGAIESYRRIPIRLADVDLETCVAIAAERGIYAYDAYVLECARRYRTPLLSLDQRQCSIGRALGIEVWEVGG